MNELTIFDMLYSKKKITKPIRLIELFGGYGSQALALKYLGVKFEHWQLVEWAVRSIQAYKDIHFPNDNEDYTTCDKYGVPENWIKEWLYKKGISSNYNEPMTKQQIDRLSKNQVKTIYNNIQATHNLVNIQQVKGKDLEIVDIDKYEYIMTYSFPCQDLSLAGKGKGMSDTTTRSGMLWEVERILTECEHKPQILLMENVPQVHSEDNLEDFNKWKLRLEELGYKNYFKDLIATDYGIPQTRNRCFMVSLLGDYSYTFPKPIPLKLKLKDMLEDDVPKKYYLSDKMIDYIYSDDNSGKYQRKKARESCDRSIEKGIACSITTKGNRPTDNFIKVKNETTKDYLEASKKDTKIYERTPLKFLNRNQKNIEGDYAFCVDTCNTGGIKEIDKDNVRIRKLTPRECFRLMGVRDEDFDKVKKNQSDSSLYHLAGDSIVVNVLMAIFKELL